MSRINIGIRNKKVVTFYSENRNIVERNMSKIKDYSALDCGEGNLNEKGGTIVLRDSSNGKYGVAWLDDSSTGYNIEWLEYEEETFKKMGIRNTKNRDKCDDISINKEIEINVGNNKDEIENNNTPVKNNASDKNTLVDMVNSIGNVGVLNVNRSKEEKHEDILKFEEAIKILSVGDVITVPNNVYESFSCMVIKMLSMSMTADRYVAIVKLRFNVEDTKYLVAIQEYDSEKSVSKIRVALEYGESTISAKDVQDIETRYEQWKKEFRY